MAKDTGNLTRIVDIVESSVDALTTFRSQKAKHLAGWWMTANGGRMPTRTMFDIADHRPIVANLFLVDVLPEGEFLFKLLGEVVIQIIGRNRTGFCRNIRRFNVMRSLCIHARMDYQGYR